MHVTFSSENLSSLKTWSNRNQLSSIFTWTYSDWSWNRSREGYCYSLDVYQQSHWSGWNSSLKNTAAIWLPCSLYVSYYNKSLYNLAYSKCGCWFVESSKKSVCTCIIDTNTTIFARVLWILREQGRTEDYWSSFFRRDNFLPTNYRDKRVVKANCIALLTDL